MSHCLLGSALGPVADSPGAEGWTGLAGQAEATLRGKAESMASGSQRVLDITAGLQVQIALLLLAGVKERGSSLLKGGFWLEIGNSFLGDFWGHCQGGVRCS